MVLRLQFQVFDLVPYCIYYWVTKRTDSRNRKVTEDKALRGANHICKSRKAVRILESKRELGTWHESCPRWLSGTIRSGATRLPHLTFTFHYLQYHLPSSHHSIGWYGTGTWASCRRITTGLEESWYVAARLTGSLVLVNHRRRRRRRRLGRPSHIFMMMCCKTDHYIIAGQAWQYRRPESL